MELDEMKRAWQGMHGQLERQQALNARLWTENRLDKVRHGMRPLFWGQVVQIAFGVVLAWMAAAFWVPRMAVTHLLAWGLLVHAFGILMIVTAARNLYLIRRIDYAAPVVDIQHCIARLRAWRVGVEAPLYAVTGSFCWIPLVLMVLAGAGIDLQTMAPSLVGYLVFFSLVSLLLAALVAWLARRAGKRRWLENMLAGESVRKAESMLEQVARFREE